VKRTAGNVTNIKSSRQNQKNDW